MDLEGAESVFQKAASKETVGIQIIGKKTPVQGQEVYGVGVAVSEEEIYYLPVQGFITSAYLVSKAEELAGVTLLSCMDVKEMLKYLSIEDSRQVFDCGIGAYLLNPLKSSYTYDDLAREYLKELFPAREELLGKLSYEKALLEKEEELAQMACYMAYTAFCTRPEIEKELETAGMQRVFREIEMPLVFALDSMEKLGIRAEAQELKRYGDKLKIRIVELEKKIWEEAGEEFNINSPKQLGVILFEKMQLPGGKKTKTGYSTAADVLENFLRIMKL